MQDTTSSDRGLPGHTEMAFLRSPMARAKLYSRYSADLADSDTGRGA